MESIIRSGLTGLGLDQHVQRDAPALLARYGQLLLEKNEVMNLTAITDPKDVATLHMLDCAALLIGTDFEGKSLIDVGTGAGFPGVPLKILVPSLKVTLLDSLNKRLDWLDEVCETLDLNEIQTVHARAEEAGRDPDLRERFDLATARAVANLRLLCELCLPFVKVGGRFLAMKGIGGDDEIHDALSAIQILGGRLGRCSDYPIPYTDVVHRVVIIEKISPTPFGYPRRWAKIQKYPL